MKSYDDPDAFDEALAITEEHIGDPPMSLEEALDEIEELRETISFLDPPYGILEIQEQLDTAEARVEELETVNRALSSAAGANLARIEEIEKELAYQLDNEVAGRHSVRLVQGGTGSAPLVIGGEDE